MSCHTFVCSKLMAINIGRLHNITGHVSYYCVHIHDPSGCVPLEYVAISHCVGEMIFMWNMNVM